MQEKRGRRSGSYQEERKSSPWRVLRSWLILLLAIALAITLFNVIRNLRSESRISVVALPCRAGEDVTPFGNNVLYYDGSSIHCLNGSGGVRWSFPAGIGARFSVSARNMVVWNGTELFIVDANGHTSYNETMQGTVQFARIGTNYCAVVFGDDTAPVLTVKDLQGMQVDTEREAYDGMMLLDVGFYGEADQYMWTLAMDVYGVKINTVMNTFQVGKMNTGVVNLGEHLAYKALYDNNQLRVFTTQQMYTYDYKAVQNMAGTQLVYGWQVIDTYFPERGPANILLAQIEEVTSAEGIKNLRVLNDTRDRRFFLPSYCVGAAVQGNSLYAFATDGAATYLYHSTTTAQRFTTHIIPLPDNKTVTGLVGLTANGRAIITSGQDVYSVSLPR